MKKQFIVGFVAGSVLFGSIGAFASNFTVVPNTFPVVMNGDAISMEGYNMKGNTYFKLRDIADKIGGFDVDFKNNTIIVETEKKEKLAGELLYQGHASFRLTTNHGKVIYIDPYAGEGYEEEADLILVTHQHPDHNKIDLPAKIDNCIIWQNFDALIDGEYKTMSFDNVSVEAVQAYNENHPIDQCVGYIVTIDGVSMYFAGDTSTTEQMASLAEKNLDYAFLPMDGKFNMDIEEAIKCAEVIKAKHTIPIHMSPGSLFNKERAELFKTDTAMIVANDTVIELIEEEK